MKAFMVEVDMKGEYIRYGLTKKDFISEFGDDTIVDLICDGDSFTIRPMVHVWAKETNVGSKEWKNFFTDMSDGLPQSDINNGVLAYVDFNRFSKELLKLMKFDKDIAR